MKTVSITITLEQDKLKALQFYAGKKGADLKSELDDFLHKLYEKYVPAQTREYIESQTEQAPVALKHPTRPAPISTPVLTDPIHRQPERSDV